MRFNRFFITMISALFIIGGTILAIRYAKGNRPTLTGEFRETGLLVVNSYPTAAQVYINGKLTTATDTTLNLDPGTYEVEIVKDGYTRWKKTLQVEKELVTQTNAVLFPTALNLSPLTYTGAENFSPSPDGQKLIFYTASASAAPKQGLYIVDLTDTRFTAPRPPRQIATRSQDINLTTASFLWSPNSSEVIASGQNRLVQLDLNQLNQIDDQPDASFTLRQTLSAWEEEMYLQERQTLSKFPPEMIQIATQSAVNVYFSPDQEKMLYTATVSATIPDELIPPLPAINTQPQARQLEPGKVYVYDRKEDTNFLVGQTDLDALPLKKTLLATDLDQPAKSLAVTPSFFTRLQATDSAQTAEKFRIYHSPLYAGRLQWYPDSRHLIKLNPDSISMVEYDGTNEVIVYAGPFDPTFVYPWSNGDKLIISTSFTASPSAAKNLYVIQLK